MLGVIGVLFFPVPSLGHVLLLSIARDSEQAVYVKSFVSSWAFDVSFLPQISCGVCCFFLYLC